ncbi:MAG: hypothetical protein IJU62_02665, partial [Muribaculaceae bacterium]|nr:hypothetical protein [Muribaculaceae bacterium]
ADGVKLKASYAFDPLNAVVDPIIGPIDGPIEGPITPINAGAPIVEPQDNPDHPVVDPGIVPETERVQSWRDYSEVLPPPILKEGGLLLSHQIETVS